MIVSDFLAVFTNQNNLIKTGKSNSYFSLKKTIIQKFIESYQAIFIE